MRIVRLGGRKQRKRCTKCLLHSLPCTLFVQCITFAFTGPRHYVARSNGSPFNDLLILVAVLPHTSFSPGSTPSSFTRPEQNCASSMGSTSMPPRASVIAFRPILNHTQHLHCHPQQQHSSHCHDMITILAPFCALVLLLREDLGYLMSVNIYTGIMIKLPAATELEALFLL